MLVYDSSAPNVVTTAFGLGLAGCAVYLASNDPIDILIDTAPPARARAARATLMVIACAEFIAAWCVISMVWYDGAAVGVGVRNFGLGLLTAAVVRAATRSQFHLAAPLALIFPAVLPGAGQLGRIVGVALQPANLSVDVSVGVSATLLATAIVSVLSRVRSER